LEAAVIYIKRQFPVLLQISQGIQFCRLTLSQQSHKE
jgi:hypothetical protein